MSQSNGHKFYIKTFGCQMNEADSEVMVRLLEKEGYTRVGSPDSAQVVILNTCSVRQHAEDRAIGYMAALKRLKKTNSSTVFVLAGCAAQRLEGQVVRMLPFVNIVLGTDNILGLPKLLEKALQNPGERFLATEIRHDLPELPPGLWSLRRCSGSGNSALTGLVTITRGCNNFCSYCIVPYVRGRERSRPIQDILREVKEKVDAGCKEIMLLGQNVNSYTFAGLDFADLLRELDKVTGLERIRFTTSHPRDVSERLINVMRDSAKVCEHFHLPAQSGSNRILARMNRGYTREHYLELVERIRKEIPRISITTDLMVGFPGETDEDFHATLSLVEKVEFDGAFTFKYSPRPGTIAAKEEDDVPMEIKKERLAQLNQLCEMMALRRNKSLVGKMEEILVERFSRREKKLVGRTRTNKTVFSTGPANCVGKLLPVRIEEAFTWSLLGRAVTSSKD